MSRQIIDLDFHKNEVLKLHQKEHAVAQIAKYLRNTYQIEIATHTIERRLQSWNVTIKRIKTNDSSKLRARITILFFQCDCNDEEILLFLKQEKYFIDRWELIRIRKEFDITRRIFVRDKEESNRILLNIVRAELDKDVAREYERELLHCHFRTQEHIVFRFVRNCINNIFC